MCLPGGKSIRAFQPLPGAEVKMCLVLGDWLVCVDRFVDVDQQMMMTAVWGGVAGLSNAHVAQTKPAPKRALYSRAIRRHNNGRERRRRALAFFERRRPAARSARRRLGLPASPSWILPLFMNMQRASRAWDSARSRRSDPGWTVECNLGSFFHDPERMTRDWQSSSTHAENHPKARLDSSRASNQPPTVMDVAAHVIEAEGIGLKLPTFKGCDVS